MIDKRRIGGKGKDKRARVYYSKRHDRSFTYGKKEKEKTFGGDDGVPWRTQRVCGFDGGALVFWEGSNELV